MGYVMNYKLLFSSALLAAVALPTVGNAAVVTCNVVTAQTVGPVLIGGCNMFSPLPSAVGNNNQQTINLQYFAGQTKIVGAALASTLSGLGITVAATQKVASDFFVFDPARTSLASGTITFANNVLGIISTRTGLIAIRPTSAFGLAGVTVNTPTLVGFERGDTASFAGNTVSLRLTGASPGDTFAVLTAVPEPSTWMMMLFGFGVAGFALRRRRQNFAVSFS